MTAATSPGAATTSGRHGAATLQELRRGWLVLITGMLGVVALQVPVHAAGVYMPIWQKAFGWSRSEMGAAISLYIAATSILAPGIGGLIDRYGARRVALISMLLLAPAYVLFAAIHTSIWSLYAAYGLVAVLGAGTTHGVFCRPIVQRFDRARGLALALVQTGTAISLFLSPVVSYALMRQVDWRGSWLFMALLPLMLLPLLFVGLPKPRTAHEAAAAAVEGGVDFGQALRSGKLWLFAGSFGLFYFGTAATMGQLLPILGGIGLSTERAIAMQGLMAAAVLVGRLGAGYLLDRVFASYVYFAIAVLASAGFLILTLGFGALAWVAVPCIGLAVGAEVDIAGYMVSRYFGRRHFGKVFGFTFATLCAGGIAAHPFYGFMYDLTGQYVVATGLSTVVTVLAAALLLRQEPYPTFEAEPA